VIDRHRDDRTDDAADAGRRATVTGGVNDEPTACRRRWSEAFRIALGNAPAEGLTQQISGEKSSQSVT